MKVNQIHQQQKDFVELELVMMIASSFWTFVLSLSFDLRRLASLELLLCSTCCSVDQSCSLCVPPAPGGMPVFRVCKSMHALTLRIDGNK
jgi:hypothetical protein